LDRAAEANKSTEVKISHPASLEARKASGPRNAKTTTIVPMRRKGIEMTTTKGRGSEIVEGILGIEATFLPGLARLLITKSPPR
jgi:hypothetical protein